MFGSLRATAIGARGRWTMVNIIFRRFSLLMGGMEARGAGGRRNANDGGRCFRALCATDALRCRD